MDALDNIFFRLKPIVDFMGFSFTGFHNARCSRDASGNLLLAGSGGDIGMEGLFDPALIYDKNYLTFTLKGNINHFSNCTRLKIAIERNGQRSTPENEVYIWEEGMDNYQHGDMMNVTTNTSINSSSLMDWSSCYKIQARLNITDYTDLNKLIFMQVCNGTLDLSIDEIYFQ